ncbi:unnamed protein product [Peronospora destructor]|uniref:Peptidase M24 domain-containing protein n=1 Tax=Peronospora destructor TaxID=86335 RepID=A0AAV0V9T1_9STRA|nr:unnamed protein product [Peronospora destructor]
MHFVLELPETRSIRSCRTACIERGCYPSPLNYYHFPNVHGDLNDTFLGGNVDDDGVRLVKTVFESLAAASKLVRPGTMFRKLGKHIAAVASVQDFSVVKTYSRYDFTIEPMINMGSWRDKTWPDEWTAVTQDGLRSAQFEHTFLVTETSYEILTARENEPVMEWYFAKVHRP